ncbi:CPBP family intramembrane glutamic endopeptidase [Krasilnikovia sp. MM14-A1004]|uniref:CPBP family intramembrane glutamic endopeptidase n=1 Tax=Krasilnikovia sp. MM14-A1004 TaxID=3373541 RepID=UPI00399C6DF1
MTAQPSTRRVAIAPAVAAALLLMVAVSLVGRYGPAHAMLVVGPVGAILLLLLARSAGLSADDVGLGRDSWRRGAAYAGVCVAAVAAVYIVAALLPGTRDAFHDVRYDNGPGKAVLTAFVVVPLGTVLFEEVAFRGVLWGLLRVSRGPTVATLVSSGLFGLWHVMPSLRLNKVNPAVTGLVGDGRAGQVLAVLGAVLFTAAAGVVFCELRRRSGSLLAPMGLHWAVNGLGVLVTAVVSR